MKIKCYKNTYNGDLVIIGNGAETPDYLVEISPDDAAEIDVTEIKTFPDGETERYYSRDYIFNIKDLTTNGNAADFTNATSVVIDINDSRIIGVYGDGFVRCY